MNFICIISHIFHIIHHKVHLRCEATVHLWGPFSSWEATCKKILVLTNDKERIALVNIYILCKMAKETNKPHPYSLWQHQIVAGHLTTFGFQWFLYVTFKNLLLDWQGGGLAPICLSQCYGKRGMEERLKIIGGWKILCQVVIRVL